MTPLASSTLALMFLGYAKPTTRHASEPMPSTKTRNPSVVNFGVVTRTSTSGKPLPLVADDPRRIRRSRRRLCVEPVFYPLFSSGYDTFSPGAQPALQGFCALVCLTMHEHDQSESHQHVPVHMAARTVRFSSCSRLRAGILKRARLKIATFSIIVFGIILIQLIDLLPLPRRNGRRRACRHYRAA